MKDFIQCPNFLTCNADKHNQNKTQVKIALANTITNDKNKLVKINKLYRYWFYCYSKHYP